MTAPDSASTRHLKTWQFIANVREAADRFSVEYVLGTLAPDGSITLTASSPLADDAARQQVQARLEQQRDLEAAGRPADNELIGDLSLWRQWVDPYHIYTDAEFTALASDIKLDFIRRNGYERP